jgi:hypothetical protein
MTDGATRPKLFSSWATRTVLLLALAVLLFIVIAKVAGPKNGQTFDGLVVVNYPIYEFYPNLKGCPPQGTPYRLVPNDDLYGQMTFYPEHFIHGVWHVKFRGDLSGIGRWGHAKKYRREVHVVEVHEVTELNCGSF